MITVNRCGYDSRHMLVLNTCTMTTSMFKALG